MFIEYEDADAGVNPGAKCGSMQSGYVRPAPQVGIVILLFVKFPEFTLPGDCPQPTLAPCGNVDVAPELAPSGPESGVAPLAPAPPSGEPLPTTVPPLAPPLEPLAAPVDSLAVPALAPLATPLPEPAFWLPLWFEPSPVEPAPLCVGVPLVSWPPPELDEPLPATGVSGVPPFELHAAAVASTSASHELTDSQGARFTNCCRITPQ